MVDKLIQFKQYPLTDQGGELVYSYNNHLINQIIISHKFPSIDTNLNKLVYYITINDDNVHNGKPKLLSTVMLSENIYTSIYTIPSMSSMPNEIDKSDENNDSIKLILLFPFDYNLNIINVEMSVFVNH